MGPSIAPERDRIRNLPDELLAYPGSKGGNGVWQRIVSEIPPHKIYIEGFAGGAAVWRHMKPSPSAWLVDADPSVIEAWTKIIRPSHHTAILASSFLSVVPRAGEREGLASSPSGASTDRTSRQGASLEHRAEKRERPTSHQDPMWTAVNVIAPESEWRRRSSLLAAMQDPDTVLYLDPPYLGETCTRNRYLHQFDSDVDHRALLRYARSLSCRVLISGYWSSLYEEMLQDWRSIHFPAMTRGGIREEWLWMNYPKPARLHDSRFVGAGFREREKVKRRRENWVAMFKAMDPGTRQEVFAGILAAWSEESGQPD